MSGLFSKVVGLGLFYGFRVGSSDLSVPCLLYLNDMVILVEILLDSLSSIKAIL